MRPNTLKGSVGMRVQCFEGGSLGGVRERAHALDRERVVSDVIAEENKELGYFLMKSTIFRYQILVFKIFMPIGITTSTFLSPNLI